MIRELVIIGGGPAGLSAAIYASRGQLNPLVIEGIIPGGQLTQTTEVENYPGFPNGILGIELVKNFRDQAQKFGTEFISENVVSISKVNDVFKITISNDQVIESKTILVATGADAKWLGIESETRLKGKGVSGCATCDGFFFKDKTIAVIGGGDSAMEEAIYLTKFASKIYLIHRKDTFRASKIMQERVLNNEKVEIIWNSEVKEVLGDNFVSGLRIFNNKTNQESILELQGMFLAIGHTPSTSFLKDTGVNMDEKGYIYTYERVVFENMSELNNQYDSRFRYITNIPGLFAAGDCTDHMYRQAGTAIGMAIAAELEIEKYLEK